jgi:ATP-binding cassette subfamily C (CFTR/MRP) protein 1
VSGRVAYVPQTAWVMNATIKENICFGRPFDGEFYNKTLKNCALLPDLASLQDGDQTEVGEKGISLSGGQKARLSLARAVYSQADVYILDDCLSAGEYLPSSILTENHFLTHYKSMSMSVRH